VGDDAGEVQPAATTPISINNAPVKSIPMFRLFFI
jgi:hypothetical protein